MPAPSTTTRYRNARIKNYNAATDQVVGYRVKGDTVDRLAIATGGTLTWGSGSATGDVSLARTGTAAATLTGALTVTGAVTLSGAQSVTGNFDVNTNKFTVNATSGNTAVAGTLGVTGVLTTTGGVAGGQQTRFSSFDIDSVTAGTDTACDNGSIWVASIWIPANCSLTGLEYLVGSVGGTDKVIAGLYNNAGTLVANSALAGATVGTAAELQQVAFTGAYNAVGPGRYFAALQFNGATAKLRTIPAFLGQKTVRIKQAGTFGTLAALSPVPTALVADVAPIVSTY